MSSPVFPARKYAFNEENPSDIFSTKSSQVSVEALKVLIEDFPKENVDASKIDSFVNRWVKRNLPLGEYIDHAMASAEFNDDEQILIVLNILAYIVEKFPNFSFGNVEDALRWLTMRAPVGMLYDLYVNGYLIHYQLLRALASRFVEDSEELKFFITKTNHLPSRQYDFVSIMISETRDQIKISPDSQDVKTKAINVWDFLISEGFISTNFDNEYGYHIQQRAVSDFSLDANLPPSVYRESLNLGRLFNPDFIELDENLARDASSAEAKYEDIYCKTVALLNDGEREYLELIYSQALSVIKTNDAKNAFKLLQQGFAVYSPFQPLFACLIAMRLLFEEGPRAEDTIFDYPPFANKFYKIIHEEINLNASSFMVPALAVIESNPKFDEDYNVGLTFSRFLMSETTALTFKKILQNPYVKANNEIIRAQLGVDKISQPKNVVGFHSYAQSPVDMFIAEWCSDNDELLTGDIVNILLEYVTPAFLDDTALMQWWHFSNSGEDYMPASWVRKFLETTKNFSINVALQNGGGSNG